MSWNYIESNSSDVHLTSEQIEENARLIASQLLNYGYTWNAIYAILGNLQVESGLNPYQIQYGYNLDGTAIKDSEGNWTYGGYGLMQWTGQPKYRLWSEYYGYDIWDGEKQIYALDINECAKYTTDSNGVASFTGLGSQYINRRELYEGAPIYDLPWEDFKTSTLSVETLTTIFRVNMEGTPNGEDERQDCAAYWQKTIGDSTPLPDVFSISVEPTILHMSIGDEATINVNATSNNNNWSYSVGGDITVGYRQDGSIHIICSSGAVKTITMLFWLTDNASVTASTVIYLNESEEEPEEPTVDYITLSANSGTLVYGGEFELLIDASNSWYYTLSDTLKLIKKTSNYIAVTTTRSDETTGTITCILKTNSSIYAQCKLYLNQSLIPDTPTTYYLNVSPSYIRVNRGDSFTVYVNTNGQWSYTESKYFDVLEKTETYIRLRVADNAPMQSYSLNFYLSNNAATIGNITVQVGKKNKWWIYLKRLL